MAEEKFLLTDEVMKEKENEKFIMKDIEGDINPKDVVKWAMNQFCKEYSDIIKESYENGKGAEFIKLLTGADQVRVKGYKSEPNNDPNCKMAYDQIVVLELIDKEGKIIDTIDWEIS
jgi:hypothetical protein